ncbi:MAG: hypothetical protein NTV34_07335 [Proteobacteria bacterium]|nr:hypothetical protein [Pseudomonadota bacterium]
MQTKILALASLTVGITFSGCVKRKSTENSSSTLLQIQETVSQDLSSEAGTPDTLCAYLRSAGYYQSNNVKAGTPVAFSTSYGVDTVGSKSAEAGQAHGVVTSDGFFSQSNMTTTQMLVCPGALQMNGKCFWKMSGDDGYAELAHRVVCNSAGNYGSKGRVHPGYNSMKTSKVTLTASTAGQSYTHSDAIKIELHGDKANALVYFAKDVGLVATEFRAETMPKGTAKVYFGSVSGGAGR